MFRDQLPVTSFRSDVWWYSCGSTSDINISVLAQSGDLRVLNIEIKSGSIPSDGFCEIQMRLAKNDWSNYDETDDPSFLASTEFQLNPTVIWVSGEGQSTETPPKTVKGPNAILLNGANHSGEITATTGSIVRMTGFPVDWRPNTLAVTFTPLSGKDQECEIEIDNKIYRIDGWYSEVFLPFKVHSNLDVNVLSCSESSSERLNATFWVDNSNRHTEPVAKAMQDQETPVSETWSLVPPKSRKDFEIEIPKGTFGKIKIDGDSSSQGTRLYINGNYVAISKLPFLYTSELLYDGTYTVSVVNTGESDLRFQWSYDVPEQWNSLPVPVEADSAPEGHLAWNYNFSLIPEVTGELRLEVDTGDFIGNIPPTMTISSRPRSNPWLKSGQTVLGPEFHIVGNIAEGRSITMALPVPLDAALNQIRTLGVSFLEDNGVTRTWYDVDSLVNGMAYFTVSNFCSGGLVAGAGGLGFFPMKLSSIPPLAIVPENVPAPIENILSRHILDGLKNTAVENREFRIFPKSLSEMNRFKMSPTYSKYTEIILATKEKPEMNVDLARTTTISNLTVYLSDLIVHKYDPQHPARRFKKFAPKWVSTFTAVPENPADGVNEMDIAIRYPMTELLAALASYSSCDGSYIAVFCVFDARDVGKEQEALTDPNRDKRLLETIDILTLLELIQWEEPEQDPAFVDAYENVISDLREWTSMTASLQRHNNIPLKAEALVALKQMRKVKEARGIFKFYEQLKLRAQLTWIQTGYINHLFEESSGAYAEGTGYLNYTNENLLLMYAMGVKNGIITTDMIPERFKKSGYWLLNQMWTSASAANVDDGVAGPKVWIAPYALITGDPVFRSWTEQNIGIQINAPAPLVLGPAAYLSYPNEIVGEGIYTPSVVLGGVAQISAGPLTMRMVAENDFQRTHGEGHDQQDNTNVTFTWLDRATNRSIDLVMDPGYAGYGLRGFTSSYDVHNTVSLGSPLFSVLPNRNLTKKEAEDIMPTELKNLLHDADAIVKYGVPLTGFVAGTFIVPIGGVVGAAGAWIGCKLFCDEVDVKNDYFDNSVEKISKELFHAGGGRATMKEVHSVGGDIKGARARMWYDYAGVFSPVANDRTIFEWNGDFFVVDEIQNPLHYTIKPSIHWNIRPADDGSGLEQPVLQYGVFGSNPLTEVTANSEFPYNTENYIYGNSKMPLLFKNDAFQYVDEKGEGISTDAKVMELSYNKNTFANPTTRSKEVFLSTFQSLKMGETKPAWNDFNCGDGVVCLAKIGSTVHNYLVVADQARTVNLVGLNTEVLKGINLITTDIQLGVTYYSLVE